MTITLELTPELEARLYAGLAQRDPDTVREVLIEAVEPTVEALLTQAADNISEAEFERLSDSLMAEMVAKMPPNWQGLSEYAMSREGIYEDHL